MAIEETLIGLTEAIDRLIAAFIANLAAEAGAAPAADPPKQRGRPKKDQTDGPAAATEPPSSEDTAAPAPATSSETIDAGTGQVVDVRAKGREVGVKLGALSNGGTKLQALLKKHGTAPEGTDLVKFSHLTDEALPAFIADCEAELAMAD